MLMLAPPSRSFRQPVDSSLTKRSSPGGLRALPESGSADGGAGREGRPAATQSAFLLRAAAGSEADSAEELVHDAQNFLSAIEVYCELLEAPGVLAPRFRHYACDLRQLGRTGARLLDRLARGLATRSSRPGSAGSAGSAPEPAADLLPDHSFAPVEHPFPPIADLADELLALRAPLQALAGPEVRLEIECAPCAGLLGLNSESLLRVLFNLVANSVEAMRRQPVAGRRKFIRIAAQRGQGASFLEGGDRSGRQCPERSPQSEKSSARRVAPTILLSVRDNGPGIAPAHLPRIFEPGFSTRAADEAGASSSGQLSIGQLSTDQLSTGQPWPGQPSEQRERPAGRGLAIVRRLVESAGGTIRAVSSPGFGARFDIELPLAAGSTAAAETRLFIERETAWKPRSMKNLGIIPTN